MSDTDLKKELGAIRQGVVEILSEGELEGKLKAATASSRPLTIKAGFDPSSADIHLGHTVLLRKLRVFQDLGHRVVFVIGDATARVGDPSGRNQMRPMLSEEQIRSNANTYKEQALKVLDPNRVEFVSNSKWFAGMGLWDLMALAARVTVGQLLAREDFQKRIRGGQPLSLLELFYPLMQAYDSVQLKADVELGGTDQKFNLLLGRELQKEMGQAPQVVITLPLLVGLDGTQKMSKSLGNHIGVLDSPKEMFGKVMSIPDSLIGNYFALLCGEDGAKITARWAGGLDHPRDSKARLAYQIVTQYHDAAAADKTREEFRRVFTEGGTPDELPTHSLESGRTPELFKFIVQLGAAQSTNESKRLIEQGAVSLDGIILKNHLMLINAKDSEQILKIGKRRFYRLK